MRTLVAALLLLLAAATPALATSTFTVKIASVDAERAGASVLLTVRLVGTGAELVGLAPTPVAGEVDVTTPTPCWPDHLGACADVVTTKTQTFLTFGAVGAWDAVVGPYSYPASPVGLACERVEVEARASSGVLAASDRVVREVCA